MWKVYKGADCRPRPNDVRRRENETLGRGRKALTRYPVGSQVKREFRDDVGQLRVFTGVVYDFSDPFWQVRYTDGDWEERNSQEMRRGRQKYADTPPLPSN